MNPLIVIPARMVSTRLPGKPLADIGGLPMIVQVMRRAEEGDCGPVLIAAAEEEIAAAVRANGGSVVLTDPDHPSGSDRVWEAVQAADPGAAHDVIVNIQGDLPTLDPVLVRAVIGAMEETGSDIGTLAAEITLAEERTNSNVVKAVFSPAGNTRTGRALYFTRATAPAGEGALYHHIGIYAYRRAALERFVGLPPSPLEQREKLEQLRALQAGMTIGCAVVDTVPLGVDAPEDLARARAMLAPGGAAA